MILSWCRPFPSQSVVEVDQGTRKKKLSLGNDLLTSRGFVAAVSMMLLERTGHRANSKDGELFPLWVCSCLEIGELKLMGCAGVFHAWVVSARWWRDTSEGMPSKWFVERLEFDGLFTRWEDMKRLFAFTRNCSDFQILHE